MPWYEPDRGSMRVFIQAQSRAAPQLSKDRAIPRLRHFYTVAILVPTAAERSEAANGVPTLGMGIADSVATAVPSLGTESARPQEGRGGEA